MLANVNIRVWWACYRLLKLIAWHVIQMQPDARDELDNDLEYLKSQIKEIEGN